MSGNSRTGRRCKPISPNKTSARLIIEASTGRWMVILGRIGDSRSQVCAVGLLAVQVRLRSLGWREFHLRAGPQLLRPFDNDKFSAAKPSSNFNFAARTQAGRHRFQLRGITGFDRVEARFVAAD